MEVFKKLFDQIMAVRDTGEANMLNMRAVQVVANRLGFYELVCFIEEQPRSYWKFIMDGDVRHLGAPTEDVV